MEAGLGGPEHATAGRPSSMQGHAGMELERTLTAPALNTGQRASPRWGRSATPSCPTSGLIMIHSRPGHGGIDQSALQYAWLTAFGPS